MRNSRRLAVIGATMALAGAVVGGSASAQTAEANAFEGRATADAMTISLFGQTVTSSAVTAEVKPSFAKATVSETLLGPLREAEVFEAESTSGPAESRPEACTGSDLTAIPGVNRFDVTCGEATVNAGPNEGTARALGAEVVVQASASEVLSTLQIQEPAQEGVNALLDGLNENLVQPLTGNPLGDLVEDAVITVQQVLNDVLSLQSTARIVIAPALADVEATADQVRATAHAQGVRIELLPVDETGATNGLLPDDLEVGEPLVTITIGDARAEKIVNRANGESQATSSASLVTVRAGTARADLLETLGLAGQEITLEAGQSLCLLEDTPLETCITVANAGVDADGNPFADGTSVQLMKGVNGGVDLALGRASTGGAATQEAPQVQEPPSELPRTGGPAALPVIGGGLLAAAAIARRFARRA
jgi:hypothetical protein